MRFVSQSGRGYSVEAIGINLGYLLLQVVCFLVLPGLFLAGLLYLLLRMANREKKETS
jgi:hypothetical protein